MNETFLIKVFINFVCLFVFLASCYMHERAEGYVIGLCISIYACVSMCVCANEQANSERTHCPMFIDIFIECKFSVKYL